MSVPASTQANQGAFQFDRTFIGLTAFQTIFTVPAFGPARIDTVFFVADFGGLAVIAEAIVLRIRSDTGVTVFTQATAIMNADGTLGATQAWCTWARGATGSNQDPAPAPANVEGVTPYFFTLPLSEQTMPALTTVDVALYEDQDGGTGTMTLQDIAVTYTPDGATVANTTPDNVFPLLLPASTS